MAPRFQRYRWPGGEDWMLCFGPQDGPQVIAALPLFEEANRTRTFVVAILRLLAERGIGGVLPDLPGQGESLVPTAAIDLADLRSAFAAAVEQASIDARERHVLAVRSGALLVDAASARSHWFLSPQSGPELARELSRVAEPGTPLIAGNRVPASFMQDLARTSELVFAPSRIVRLDSDPRPADRKVTASPLWRRSEPDNDVALAQSLTADIADWIATCAT